MKKAQIQLQFNWIYVAVVGVVFLLLFLSISSLIKRNSEANIASEAVDYFEEIFINLQASDNTEDTIALSGLTLEVATDRDNCNFYTIEGTDLEGRSIEFTPLFSPDTISRELLAYTLGWDMPFRTAYFLYLTGPENAYIAVGGNVDLPEHITAQTISSASSAVNENYDNMRFISSGSDPESFSLHNSVMAMPDEDVSAVLVGGNTLRYYGKQGSRLVFEGESQYADRETMLAGIYSESRDSYECNMMKSLKRLNRLSLIMIERTESIKEISGCDGSSYDFAISHLAKIESLTDTPDMNALPALASEAAVLDSINDELNRKACPTIY